MVCSIQQCDRHVIDAKHLASQQESVVPEEHDCCCLTSFRVLMNSHPAADWADLQNCLQQNALLNSLVKAVCFGRNLARLKQTMQNMQIDCSVLFASSVFVKQHDIRQKANITLAVVTSVTEAVGSGFFCMLKAVGCTLQQL